MLFLFFSRISRNSRKYVKDVFTIYSYIRNLNYKKLINISFSAKRKTPVLDYVNMSFGLTTYIYRPIILSNY